MSEIKRIDVREFQEAGFLLEANRLFFHPHGLALEITRVAEEEGAPVRIFALNQKLYDELISLVGTAEQEGDYASDELRNALDTAAAYNEGDAWISGVWDCRDDPEGVYMGGGLTDVERERVACVAAERDRHRAARAEMFAANTFGSHEPRDVQPVDWIPEEESADV